MQISHVNFLNCDQHSTGRSWSSFCRCKWWCDEDEDDEDDSSHDSQILLPHPHTVHYPFLPDLMMQSKEEKTKWKYANFIQNTKHHYQHSYIGLYRRCNHDCWRETGCLMQYWLYWQKTSQIQKNLSIYYGSLLLLHDWFFQKQVWHWTLLFYLLKIIKSSVFRQVTKMFCGYLPFLLDMMIW